jgi:hypothetical protein
MDGSSMRYSLDSFLPLGAFEHCGNGKIRLHGGGGGGFIGDIVSGVGDAVSDVFSGASDALAQIDPGPAIGDAGQAIDETVNDVVPGGWGMVGAVALSVLSAGTVNLEAEALAADAAEIAAEEYLTDAAIETGVDTLADTSLEAGADYAGDAAYEAQGLQEGYESAANTLGDVTNPDGSITSTFDDGSTVTRMGSEIVSNTPAISDPFQLDEFLKAAKYAKTAYNVANTANKLLNPTAAKGALTRASTLTGTRPSSLSGLSNLSDAIGGPSSTSGSGALPGSLQATSLAAAPVTQGSSNMNINQLKQLYPQLSTVDPRILSSLTGKSAAVPNYYTYGGNQSAGGTALTNQGQGGSPQPGYPSISADSKGTSTAFANPTSPNASYNALSAAGLRSLSTGALPGQSYYKDGGNVHRPQFKTGTTGHFVQGAGDGQSDDIPAMLADGEYVFDADTVAALGNGSSKAGALQLDKMRKAIRKHKRSASHDKIPPKAKSPLEYLKG